MRHGNDLVTYGRKIGDRVVDNSPDWSAMSHTAFAEWFKSVHSVDRVRKQD
jgi:hypothetical protein